MSATYRVFIADDHPIILNGVRVVLANEPDIEIAGCASNGDDTRRHVIRLQPDLLILDLKMPGRSPLEIIEAVREQSPQTKILVMSAFEERDYVRRLHAAGIEGYILKDEAPEMLMTAMRSILQGATWFSRSIFDTMVSLERGVQKEDDVWAQLNDRERDILLAIGKGHNNRLIAEEMHLAEQTVRNYTSHLYDKLGITSRSQAVIWMQSLNRDT